jgi:hypothetical protein
VSALCQKIQDCDRVIHVQQLGIPWAPPTDPIFKQLNTDANVTAGQSSLAGQNTSQMDSSKHGMSRSDMKEDGNMSQSTAKDQEMDKAGSQENADLRDNFFRVRNVFEILITEAPYLIDDKSL